MKKYIISTSIGLLFFVTFFLMLILTDTPMNLSLIGSGVATLVVGAYMGLSLLGKPLKAISNGIDKFTAVKKVGFFIGLLIVNFSVCGALIETKNATIETLPFAFYGIAFIVALVIGILTRKLFVSLDTGSSN